MLDERSTSLINQRAIELSQGRDAAEYCSPLSLARLYSRYPCHLLTKNKLKAENKCMNQKK